MRRPRRRLSWYIIWFVILFFALATVLSIVLSLPFWRINGVKVYGANIISEKFVSDMAKPLMGTNIFLVDYSGLKKDLENVSQLKDYGIWRMLPSTIVIRLVERKPFAVVILSGTSVVVDEDGVFLKIREKYPFVSIKDISGLPVVKGVSEKKVKNDCLPDEIAESIKTSVGELSRFLPPSNLQLEMKGGDDVNLLVEDVLRVRFGSVENISRKIAVLEAILPGIGEDWSIVDYVDIRVAASPVVRYHKRKNT